VIWAVAVKPAMREESVTNTPSPLPMLNPDTGTR
jgi:hypothetical protein